MKKHFFALLLAGALLLAACSNDGPDEGDGVSSSTEGLPSYRVAVALPEQASDVVRSIQNGCQAVKEQHAAEVSLTFDYSFSDKVAQDLFLAQAANQNYDAVLCYPVLGEETYAVLSRLHANGMPVALVGEAPSNNDFAVYIGLIDDYQLGVEVGRLALPFVKEKLGGKAELAIVSCAGSYEATTLRINGFLDQLEQEEGIELVKNIQAGDSEGLTDPLKSYLAGEKAANLYFCADGAAAKALNSALEEAGRLEDSYIFAVAQEDELEPVGEHSAVWAVSSPALSEMGSNATSALLDAVAFGSTSAASKSDAPITVQNSTGCTAEAPAPSEEDVEPASS